LDGGKILTIESISKFTFGGERTKKTNGEVKILKSIKKTDFFINSY